MFTLDGYIMLVQYLPPVFTYIRFMCPIQSGRLQLLSQREYLRGCFELGDEPCSLKPSCDVLH